MSVESLVRQLFGAEAIAAARAVADAACLARWIELGGVIGTLAKTDASPVTVADFAVQALVAGRLATAFPDVPLVAEEDATQLRDPAAARVRAAVVDFVRRFEPAADEGGVLDWIDRGNGAPGRRFWTLDPIDGTKGLLRGGQYVVALALIEDGVVQIGVVGCPRLSFCGRRFARLASEVYGPGGLAIAVRGRGAWWVLPLAEELIRLNVSTITDPTRARVLHSFEGEHSNVFQLRAVLRALGNGAEPLWMDSQAKHVVLAAGRADLLLRFPTAADAHAPIWDLAAGSLIIEEAGGRVSDLAGQPLDFSTGRRLSRNSGLIASNARLHDALLGVLGSAYQGPSVSMPRW
jgi:3'(2'), 5'-bisphosphate nucleotidase